jgi:hypothetical protein
MLAALLLSAVALAAPRPAPRTPCCPSAGTSAAAPSCCCMGEDASPDSSVGCCRMSAPEEAAPSLTSAAAPALTAPEASAFDQLLPTLPGSLEGRARRVSPRARPAPLFLLYSVFLV